jgi:Raf kinase inhibitor-like YbhB/YbcL family protein
VFNIPGTAKGFEEGTIAEGATEGLCNGNTFGYEGPCPPESEHQYLFKLYALDKILDIPNESDRKVILKEMKNHIIAEALLTGKYEKEKIKISN